MQETYRVIEPYETPFADPLKAKAGGRLRFERKETEWEGWLWCTDASGKSAWVPENWLRFEEGTCVLQRDYSSRELTVSAGELIAVEFVESDWVLGFRENGERGWVPLNHLSPVTQEPAPYHLSGEEQARMLGKLMLFWDGQWFLKSVQAFGLDAAIDLNARVRTSFGRIEMRTLLKAVGKQRANDLRDAIKLLETYAQAFMGDRLRAEFSVQGDEQVEVIIRRCAAYEGAKLAALPRQDQACVACETLWLAWLDTLLPEVTWEVQYPMRQGKGDPVCRFLIAMHLHDKPI
ncbi:MAG: SH3 domain-containing protein [Anaerolineae bacterium]|jgi:hypothetical protein